MDGLNSILVRDPGFYRKFCTLATTLILEQSVVLSVNLADNIMLGNYSEFAMAGVAAVNQIQFVLQQVVFAVANGVIILASQYWGQRRVEPIRKLLTIGFWTAMSISAVLFLFVSLWPRFAVGLFTKDAAIVSQAIAYLRIIRFTYPVFAATTILLGSMRAVENVRIALAVSVVALIINCLINFLLIPGRLGFPELGARGAAIGTLSARVLEFLIVWFYVSRRDNKLSYRLRQVLAIDRLLARDYLLVTLPIIGTAFLWGCSSALQTAIMGHLSANAMAAQSISSTIFLFLKVAAVGAGSAAAILVGKIIGGGDMESLRPAVRTLQLLFLLVGLFLGGVMLAIRAPLLGFYTLSPDTRAFAERFMLLEAAVLCSMSYQRSVNIGIIQGGGDSRFVLVLDIVSIWIIVVPLSWLAAFTWGLSPMWVLILLNADQFFKCIPAALYCNSYLWVKKLTR